MLWHSEVDICFLYFLFLGTTLQKRHLYEWPGYIFPKGPFRSRKWDRWRVITGCCCFWLAYTYRISVPFIPLIKSQGGGLRPPPSSHLRGARELAPDCRGPTAPSSQSPWHMKLLDPFGTENPVLRTRTEPDPKSVHPVMILGWCPNISTHLSVDKGSRLQNHRYKCRIRILMISQVPATVHASVYPAWRSKVEDYTEDATFFLMSWG